MKNLYFTADGIFDGIKSDGIFNGIKSDGSYILETLNLGVHSVAAFIWGMDYEWMLMIFN